MSCFAFHQKRSSGTKISNSIWLALNKNNNYSCYTVTTTLQLVSPIPTKQSNIVLNYYVASKAYHHNTFQSDHAPAENNDLLLARRSHVVIKWGPHRCSILGVRRILSTSSEPIQCICPVSQGCT